MSAERALHTARLARAFGVPMAVVREMTMRDVDAMVEVLGEEERERKRAQARARRR